MSSVKEWVCCYQCLLDKNFLTIPKRIKKKSKRSRKGQDITEETSSQDKKGPGDNQGSPKGDLWPSGDNKSPSGDNKSSSGDNKSLPGDNLWRSGDNKSLPGGNLSPSAQDRFPCGDNKSFPGGNLPPSAQDKSSSGDNRSLPGDNLWPSDGNTTSSAQEKSLQGGNTTSAAQEKFLHGNNRFPSGGNTTSSAQDKSSFGDNKSSSGNHRFPSGDNRSHVAGNGRSLPLSRGSESGEEMPTTSHVEDETSDDDLLEDLFICSECKRRHKSSTSFLSYEKKIKNKIVHFNNLLRRMEEFSPLDYQEEIRRVVFLVNEKKIPQEFITTELVAKLLHPKKYDFTILMLLTNLFHLKPFLLTLDLKMKLTILFVNFIKFDRASSFKHNIPYEVLFFYFFQILEVETYLVPKEKKLQQFDGFVENLLAFFQAERETKPVVVDPPVFVETKEMSSFGSYLVSLVGCC